MSSSKRTHSLSSRSDISTGVISTSHSSNSWIIEKKTEASGNSCGLVGIPALRESAISLRDENERQFDNSTIQHFKQRITRKPCMCCPWNAARTLRTNRWIYHFEVKYDKFTTGAFLIAKIMAIMWIIAFLQAYSSLLINIKLHGYSLQIACVSTHAAVRHIIDSTFTAWNCRETIKITRRKNSNRFKSDRRSKFISGKLQPLIPVSSARLLSYTHAGIIRYSNKSVLAFSATSSLVLSSINDSKLAVYFSIRSIRLSARLLRLHDTVTCKSNKYDMHHWSGNNQW